MMNHQHDIIDKVLILFILLIFVGTSLQDIPYSENEPNHLPDTKFNFNEYSEYPDSDDKDRGPQAPQWDQILSLNRNAQLKHLNYVNTPPPLPHFSNKTDENIHWISDWASNLKFGQISAVSIDPDGNIAVFHRGDRVWGSNTFDNENRFDPSNGPIKQNTIILLHKTGESILQWGSNMFYLPHGLTVDDLGNYWITDVAMHQVFKFDAEDIKKNWDKLTEDQNHPEIALVNIRDSDSLFQNSILKPSLILGEAFQPGNDEKRFCKPTAVAVQKNGDFFVSDGYCNSRIIKFNKNGERILQWGRHWGQEESVFLHPPPPNAFFVPHALTLAEDLNYIFVADRENGRVLCFFASNGTFHKEYKHPVLGTKIYSVAYAQRKIYLVNGPEIGRNYIHIRGYIVNISSGDVLSQFTPDGDMNRPHDIAVTENGNEIYVVELDIRRIYKFVQAPVNNSIVATAEPVTDAPMTITLVLSFLTAAIVFISLCIGIAAIVARCRKRGRSYNYKESSVEFTKLVE